MSDKNVRRLSDLCGIEFKKVGVRSDGHLFAEGVTADDVHYEVDRRTGEAKLSPDANHWASCLGLE